MKRVRGVWLPDDETHLVPFIEQGPERHGRGTYQFHKYERALHFVRHRRHAVDIGAHVGLWSYNLAHDFQRVTLFEPHPRQVECLAANMSDVANWTHYQVALGRSSGVVMMAAPKGNTGNTHVAADGETGVEVPVRPLDSYGLDDVDFIKIDVEGFETEVVAGAEQTIKANRPTIIIEQKPRNAERYGRGQWEAVSMLKAWGMREVANIGGDHIMIW